MSHCIPSTQAQAGNPHRGLAEQERAAKQGLGATYNKTAQQPVETLVVEIDYYYIDSCSRIFYAGYGHKTYLKKATNDVEWRVAA